MFLVQGQDIGRIQVGSKNVISFKYEGLIVKKVETPCDCTRSVIDNKNQAVIIEYTAKPIPEHLKSIGRTEYPILKKVTVTYITKEDPKEQIVILAFSGIVYK